jgi:hypothetical protein
MRKRSWSLANERVVVPRIRVLAALFLPTCASDNRRAKLVQVFSRQRNEGDEAGMLQILKNHAEKCGDHLRYFQTQGILVG